MKYLITNFKRLSAKQIKTYAAVVLMSALSLDATAFVAEMEANPETGMVLTMETSFVEEMYLERWMFTPFEVGIDQVNAYETVFPALTEATFETEIALESWMAVPFELNISKQPFCEITNCCPAP